MISLKKAMNPVFIFYKNQISHPQQIFKNSIQLALLKHPFYDKLIQIFVFFYVVGIREIEIGLQYKVQFEMQNDISLQQVKKDTAERQLQLEKMKKNIEALQINMAKKKLIGKSNTSIYQPKHLDPQSHQPRLDSDETLKSPINYQGGDRQFGYNSALFKIIYNDSQPIMQNGSGVSNFSSVSNINNILNNNKQQKQQKVVYGSSSNNFSNDLLGNIDKVLEKVQKSQKLPVKTLQKIIEHRQQKPNSSIISNQSFMTSKIQTSKKEVSARTKLQQYKQMIQNLDANIQQKHKVEANFTKSKLKNIYIENNSCDVIQNHFSKPSQKEQYEEIVQNHYKQHKKNTSSAVSGFNYKSQYGMSESIKLPPTPPPRPKVVENVVERQKAKIKQSVQQYKKIQTECSHQILDKSQIEFELSDQQQYSEEQRQKQGRKKQLLKQKQQLLFQLQEINQALRKLECDDQFD